MQSNEEIIVRVKNNIQPESSISNSSESMLVDPILKGFFRINENELSQKDRSRLDEINDFLGDDSDFDKLGVLKDIRYKLGSPRLGTSEIDHIHRYVRIKNSIKQKEAELLSMEE